MPFPASHTSNIFASPPSQASNASRRLFGFGQESIWLDLFFAALAMAIYILWIDHFRYQGLLGEDDLYRVLVGLLDGARSGAHMASQSHYGKAFSFGYIAAFYRFVAPRTLADPQRLIALINEIGFWSAAAGCFSLWLLTWLLYGLRSATVALILFALSPMMLELGTSGHPILPAFAFFAAGSCCLLLPVRGVRAILLSVPGALLLTAALVTRAELLLAFPFVVLARTDFRSFPHFLKFAAQRAIAPTIAAVAFFLLKHAYADSTPGTGQLAPFLEQFIRLKDIPIGVFVFTLSCGIATAIVGLIAVFLIVRSTLAAPSASPRRAALLHSAIGPLLLIAPALAFWIANPRPGRHFILCLAGVAILAGWMFPRYLPARPLQVYALAVGVVIANQALGALTGPFILNHAPSKIIALPGGLRHLPRGFPTGSSWGYHRAFVAEQLRTTAFARRVQSTCEAKTMVMSLDATQIFSDLYPASNPWNEEKEQLNRFPILAARVGGHAVLVLSESEGWPRDPAADALADPAFRDYKLVRDPNNLSIYDHAVIPPGRIAHLDCAP
jgi:hypothetical protein